MKTSEDILISNLPHMFLNVNIKTIQKVMKEYALEAIKEDRINLAEHARAVVSTNGEWTSAKVSATIDKGSIINAPYPELK